MNSYIALLRGINVGGQKQVPMPELRELLTKTGLKKVKTYIQSGNIIFQSSEENIHKLEGQIQLVIHNHFGFEVPVLVKAPANLQKILNNCPFCDEQKKDSYFVLLFSKPNMNLVKDMKNISYTNETYAITEDCVYLHCATGYGKAKLNNNVLERKLKTTATARNYKTMVKLLALASTD